MLKDSLPHPQERWKDQKSLDSQPVIVDILDEKQLRRLLRDLQKTGEALEQALAVRPLRGKIAHEVRWEYTPTFKTTGVNEMLLPITCKE